MHIKAWRMYFSLFRGFGLQILAIVLVTVFTALVQLPILVLIRRVFDVVLPSKDMQRLIWMGLGISGLYVLQSGAMLLTEYLVVSRTRTVITRLRKALLDKLFTFSRSYYSHEDCRIIQTAIVQDTQRIDHVAYALLGQVVPGIFISLVLCGCLVYLNWLLFLALLTILPVIVGMNRIVTRYLRQSVQRYHRALEQYSKGVLFVLQFMDLAWQRSARRFEIDRQGTIIEDLAEKGRLLGIVNALYSQINSTIVTVSGIIVIIAGGWAMAANRMTLGDLIVYLSAVALLRRYLGTLLSFIPRLLEGDESLRTLQNLLDVSDVDPYHGTETQDFSGNISLKHIAFSYCPGDRQVLIDVTLDIRQSQCTLLMGENGSGKTTIANLILGFYRPVAGTIAAEGMPYDRMDMDTFRSHIGVVTQNPVMLPGTIMENITYGHTGIDRDDIDRVMGISLMTDFIDTLPKGLDTFIGEDGLLLSGGQGQRIAIARALLHRPRLLILDEPANHLDQSAFQRLMKNLSEMPDRPAMLIISHQRDYIDFANSVCFLRDGRIDPIQN